MNINIPAQFRTEFNKSADFAVKQGDFTPSQLAEYLERGVVVASMMVRYMENAELVTKGKGEEVRHARITQQEWESIGKRIENYVPVPEPEVIQEEELPCEEEPVPTVTVDDIISDKLEFIGKTLWTDNGTITLSNGTEQTEIPLTDICSLYIHKGRLFGKSMLTLSCDGEMPVKAKFRSDTVLFKNRDYTKIKSLADRLAERLEIEVKSF